MNLEVNLVKVDTIDSKLSKLLARNRFLVENDTQALDSIVKFIADNASTFNAALTDQRLVAQLQNLSSLTITDLDCLRYILSSKGIDIWYFYVSDVEVDQTDIPTGIFEYNVVDTSNMMSAFIPFSTKITQAQTENKLTTLYDKIIDMYGLFSGKLFSGINNPIKVMVDSMKGDEEILGTVPTTKSTYCNSIFDFLKKDIKVITN